MNRDTIRKIHGAAGGVGTLLIGSFWTSTLISELFLSQAAVAQVKQVIVYAMFLLIACMATAGATGMKMGAKSKHPKISNKRKRMPFIAMNGLLVLLPCAFFLNSKAAAGEFDAVFYAVQALELLAGATNFTLMSLSMKDGFSIRKPKKALQAA